MDKYQGYSSAEDIIYIGAFIITITIIVMVYGQIKRHYINKKPKWLDKM